MVEIEKKTTCLGDNNLDLKKSQPMHFKPPKNPRHQVRHDQEVNDAPRIPKNGQRKWKNVTGWTDRKWKIGNHKVLDTLFSNKLINMLNEITC